MATEGPQICIPGLTASASLTAKQYYFVKMSGASTVTVCSGATDVPIGVLQNAPASGAAANVCSIGVTKISSDAAVTYGNHVGTSADGQADPKVWGTDTTEYIVGQAITTSGGAGGMVTAMINCATPVMAQTSA